jgi:hypothetical protein
VHSLSRDAGRGAHRRSSRSGIAGQHRSADPQQAQHGDRLGCLGAHHISGAAGGRSAPQWLCSRPANGGLRSWLQLGCVECAAAAASGCCRAPEPPGKLAVHGHKAGGGACSRGSPHSGRESRRPAPPWSRPDACMPARVPTSCRAPSPLGSPSASMASCAAATSDPVTPAFDASRAAVPATTVRPSTSAVRPAPGTASIPWASASQATPYKACRPGQAVGASTLEPASTAAAAAAAARRHRPQGLHLRCGVSEHRRGQWVAAATLHRAQQPQQLLP